MAEKFKLGDVVLHPNAGEVVVIGPGDVAGTTRVRLASGEEWNATTEWLTKPEAVKKAK